MTKKSQASNQDAAQRIAEAFQEALGQVPGDHETAEAIRFEASLHTALVARGWSVFNEDEDPSEYISEWEDARPEPDHENDLYYETTSIEAQENRILVEFAAPQDGPFAAAHYQTLEQLLADISLIETFRHGSPLPDLNNAQKALSNLPTLKEFYEA